MSTAAFPKCTLYYFKTKAMPQYGVKESITFGLGEHVKLLLEDAAIEHEYVRVVHEDWPSMKEQLIQEGYPMATLPVLELRLGKYLGADEEENQYLDALSDTAMDWHQDWIKSKILGNEISYVDFLVYHRIDDDKADYEAYPHVANMIKAINDRPALQNHFAKVKEFNVAHAQ
ncbi:hypothetical protein EC973_000470 [Apophysomyces ossiformis]|uniref:Glutathione S-transferase C-terminal domain-containing protein n=1 Tax=Apophysomyces ossiformis TaxID=679940 RepID=A0A8H7BNE2_9FUNG|nr:hypothetical protein EC973_000470 [Apophysomyces ossiformis]